MKGVSQEDNQFNFCLPDDMVLLILLLLPFESILACKRVCKQWYNLINDSKISKEYHYNGSLILFLDVVDLFCVLIRQCLSYSVHRIPISLAKGSELLSGWSSGGIACVKAENGYFHLYNLFTGVLHTVEDAPLRVHSKFWMCYGFGYDPYDDDHKIFLVYDYCAINENVQEKVIDIDKAENKEKSLFWIYSSRNRRWKSFNGFPYSEYWWHPSFAHGSFSFNGVLHYSALKRASVVKEEWERVIVTYDLHTRRFGEIYVHDDGYYDLNHYMQANVTEVDGKLCYAYYQNKWIAQKQRFIDEWIVQIYGVDGSWEKMPSIDNSTLCGIRYVSLHRGVRYGYSLRGLTYMARYGLGDDRKVVLFVSSDGLLWYDFSKNDFTNVVDVHTDWLLRQEQRRDQ